MLPVESIAGASNASYEPEAGDGEDFRRMVEEMRYSLIVTIAEKGCVDMVMDAAREAGCARRYLSSTRRAPRAAWRSSSALR